MKSLTRNIALASMVLSGCSGCDPDKGRNNTSPNPGGSNRAPIISAIPRQEVNEGNAYTFDFNPYVSDPDGDPVIVTKNSAGIGSITDNVFNYFDIRENDGINNVYRIEFMVSDGKGGNTPSSFDINQNDNFHRVDPWFLAARSWMAYSPTNFNPTINQYPDEASLRADLEKLVSINTYGIVTYGSENTLAQIPRIAKDAGIQKVVQGVWDPLNANEIANALQVQEYVDGYCVGNEGLGTRYDLPALEQTINFVRGSTNKSVTTTEIIQAYDNPALLEVGDWVFPNAHPYWQGIRDPALAVEWTVNQHNLLSGRTPLRVVFKEVGLPSEGEAGLSQENQNSYYRGLENAFIEHLAPNTKFMHFEAFDQPWKNNHPVEPHWGLFNSDRTPKIVATPQVLHRIVPRMGSFDDLFGRVVNVKPENYKVSTYVYNFTTWWMKPTFANPLTSIDPGSNWMTDITTGGSDHLASPINSYLVTPDYVPQHNVLPVVNGRDVVHFVSSGRPQ